jgi:hypothetical protein
VPSILPSRKKDALARLCADAKFEAVRYSRFTVTLAFADANEACDAGFVGGPSHSRGRASTMKFGHGFAPRYLDGIDLPSAGYGVPTGTVFVVLRPICRALFHFIPHRQSTTVDVAV